MDLPTQTVMRNIFFYLDDHLVLRIRHLRGALHSRVEGLPVIFDDKMSFVFEIKHAEVGITAQDLTYLMNRHIFAYPGAPLRNLEITTVGDRIRQTGILRRIVDIPFEMTADLRVTPEGHIRIHPVAMEICNIPGFGLMRAVGVQMADLLDLERVEGVRVEGNDIILDPERILPPPAVRGRLTAVRVEGEEVVQTFGTAEALAGEPELVPRDPTAPSYMYFRGGTLRFGKLYMVDADMQVVSAESTDNFHFFLDHYRSQLIAGYNTNLRDFGLLTVMRDFREVGKTVQPEEEIPLPHERRP